MKKKNIAISFLLLLVAAGIWYYVSLPAFNIHSSGVWYFVLVLVLAVGLVFAGKKGLRYGAIDLKEMKESKGFKWCVRLFIFLLVIYLAGTILSSPIVNAKKYQQLLKVEEGEFTKDIEELSFDQIPLLDKESAQLLGDRKMGSMSDMVSQFEVDDIYSQINYKDRPVRVSPLKYANLIKWFTNRKDGLPAYIRIDMASQTTEMVKLEQGMKYSTSEHFGRNIYRHLRFVHPTYIYGDLSFEIDDNGVPYWVAPVKKYNIGLFGGETVGHVVLCNAITGEMQDYRIDEVPEWIDRAYSADLLVQSYHRTYGLPVTISRCSNNYGPYHFPEKLIPLIISRALADEELPVYGTGENVRDWLHVSDHCEAIDLIIHKGRVGEVYNIGGHNERTNLEVVKTILKALNKPESLIKFVTDRPGHDRRYAIDPTKIETELGWKPKYNFDTGIQQTIQWYLDNQEWWKNILSGEYSNYFDKMYGNRL